MLLGVAAAGRGAGAQQPDTIATVVRNRIEASRTIRIELHDRTRPLLRGATVDGLGLHFSPDDVVATGGNLYGLPSPIAWGEVRRVDVRTGSYGRRGAVIGLILGAVAGAMVLSAVGDCDDCPQTSGTERLAWFLVFPSGGAVVGGLFGLGIPRWQRVYP